MYDDCIVDATLEIREWGDRGSGSKDFKTKGHRNLGGKEWGWEGPAEADTAVKIPAERTW